MTVDHSQMPLLRAASGHVAGRATKAGSSSHIAAVGATARCSACLYPLDSVLAAAGEVYHPCCSADALQFVEPPTPIGPAA